MIIQQSLESFLVRLVSPAGSNGTSPATQSSHINNAYFCYLPASLFPPSHRRTSSLIRFPFIVFCFRFRFCPPSTVFFFFVFVRFPLCSFTAYFRFFEYLSQCSLFSDYVPTFFRSCLIYYVRLIFPYFFYSRGHLFYTRDNAAAEHIPHAQHSAVSPNQKCKATTCRPERDSASEQTELARASM